MLLKFALVLSLACFALHADTTVLYDPSSPDTGPFPSDELTESDTQQLTGKRINLPFPQGCTPTSPESVCSDVALLNQLDGFSVYPQLRVCFSGPVRPSTIQGGLYVASLSRFAPLINVNRVIYDSSTNCALAKPDAVLESGKRYAFVATNAIRDIGGKAVQPDARFTGIVGSLQPLLSQIAPQVVGGSVFTTLSATDWIEKAHRHVISDPLAGFIVPDSFTVAKLSDLSSINWLVQTSFAAELTPVKVPLE